MIYLYRYIYRYSNAMRAYHKKWTPPQIHHFIRKFAKKNNGFEVKGAYIRISTLVFPSADICWQSDGPGLRPSQGKN